ncbi:MAG TPA: hypothetical protein VFZ83_07190 [Acidimicrobiia bacterium]|nr:hypothetical protein [Acidimicrobiia bacterium]
MPDPRSPVVVGVGQTAQRVPADQARSPIELLVDAARRADADAGATRSLVDALDVVAVVQIASWPYADPGRFVARELGTEPRRTVVSTVGGNSPLLLVHEMAADIAAGRADVVLVGGAEAMHTRWRARREPRVHLTWPTGDDAPCLHVVGDDRPGSNEYENAHHAFVPVTVYPLLETALRARARRDVAEHQRAIGALWSTFAAVAEQNPAAWSRTAYSPDEIATPSTDNRVVCFPYLKRMCANIDVDQGAALLLCAYETAVAAGVPADRMVFLHAGADGHDHYWFSERDSLAAAPGIGVVVRDALGANGLGVDDVARFDLYSCFPSAVQLALDALGMSGPTGGDTRPLTTTGGLAFAGGPVNNYSTHGVATMVDALRADPGSVGVTTALGWYATKHSASVWSTRPPATGFQRVDPAATQARIDALPRREVAGLVVESVRIEATSVMVERDGTPQVAIVAAHTADGRRVLATTRDADMMGAMVREPWEGRTVEVDNDGTTNTVRSP